MESKQEQLSPEDRKALCQLEQKSSNLRQSSGNNFLVSLEGLMLAAIAWEGIGKEHKWKFVGPLSKVTTAIGLAVTGIFAANALSDRAKAHKIDAKLKQYGVDEMTLPCEMKAAEPVRSAIHPHHARKEHHGHQPHTRISTNGAEVAHLQEAAQQQAAI